MSLDLEAIKARAEAATPGPWRWRGNTDTDDPRIVGGPSRHTVLVVMRRQRKADDREAKSFDAHLRECDVPVEDADADGKTRYRPLTDEEVADRVRDEWLEDPWGGPAYDLRLAFRDPETNIMGYARDMAVYEVCPDATGRDDKRVYRADVVGLRHPDAEFIAHAREDVDALIAEVERLTARLAEARSQLEGWEQVGNNIAHHIPEHYEAGYNSHEDWAKDAADVVAKAHAWRKNGRRTPGACRCHCQLALPAANPWDHAEICPAYVAREEIHLDAAVEKIYPTGVYL